MVKALVVYDSATGNTEKMAVAIGDGLKEIGLDVEVKKVGNTKLDDLVAADAIVMGSPTYFSTMTAKMKAFIDKSVDLWPNEPGTLKNKIGAAFTSCAGAEGGNETTLLSLIRAMLWHGMVIVGHQSGACGAVSVEAPDEKCLSECKEFGKRIGSLAKPK
jgi:NAD(P)H dehydrogenase (quinone)